MIHDTKELETGTSIEADVCIVGAGAAGISLALELANQGRSVAFLEGGGRESSPESQELYHGKADAPLQNSYLFFSRLRFFGGTTNHWTGCCLPLDPLDFEARPWVPESGWPFSRDELEPFYARAATTCGIDGQVVMSEPELLGESRVLARRPQVLNPVRFGSHYESELSKAPNLDLYLHANVIQIHLRANGAGVDWLEVATDEGKRFRAQARAYVLAMGAIENARLMLCSTGVHGSGVGNQEGLVGRYYMDHPAYEIGTICARGESPLLTPNRWGSEYRYLLTPEIQEREELLNCSLDFRELIEVEDPFQELAAEGVWQWTSGYLEEGGLAVNETVPARSGADLYHLRTFGFRPEQPPTRDSRVELGEKKDRFGLPRAHLRWRLPPSVVETVERTAELVSRELGRLGYGRLLVESIEGVNAGYHHAGTTRMAPDPRRGVVDADCKVHGVGDLYVAGGSVFPTCGDANPTFTIVALALRLADHLAGRLAREAA